MMMRGGGGGEEEEGEGNGKRKPNADFAVKHRCLSLASSSLKSKSSPYSDSDMMTMSGEGGGEGKGKRKRIQRCSSTSTADLPMDIIKNEILPRLPVKSLLRFKSVCKLWYSIIKSPNFVSTHYNLNNHRHRRPLFLEHFYNLIHEKERQGLIAFNPSVKTEYSVWPIKDNHDSNSNLLFSYYLGLPGRAIFLRPVNGLLLMLIPDAYLDYCRMALLNPATRQFHPLLEFKFIMSDWDLIPDAPVGEYYPTMAGQIFGFGTCRKKYSTTSTTTSSTRTNLQPQPDPHAYKVVWLHTSPTSPDSTHDDVAAVAKVYTVGDQSQCWRTIYSALPYSYVENYSNNPSLNICMNGKCYWLSRDLRHILVFDMDEEVFREMDTPLPSAYHLPDKFYSYAKMSSDVALTEVRFCGGESEGEGDCLALFIFEPEFVDISVMDKEEGWHWTRRVVTYIDRLIDDLLNPLLQFPITEAILLKAGRISFALYNPMTNECVRFCESSSKNDTRGYEQVRVFNFKESLFSMDGGIQLSDRMLEDFSNF